ncbi:MAG TPA: 2-hydroxyacyl-CoA dehydratase family protein [Dictyoglomaceae bacterium]|nr:2-hydroxyacyl-CoA dehydratase family protein [Dictyoglomaceae bacterium]HOL39304.1 2-hydroxyacyl-CoA dehydratase family protein [Dictyoglomaceae bacterium]HOP95043.1 2-hydroxyacyl-CoA dehydratase family protein [Dictyoglomaceae bacterium]HPP16014.1 2-hydroxyacyl-CoA dehydratase family protein [Dictyoglomaceae bacterium]HPU42965.1 2-hydroxyacyl-CoA dehydratase family protein [Dictyoglomaceae bacterium]
MEVEREYKYLNLLKEELNRGKYVGYFCAYVPPEIIYAASFTPLPIIFPSVYPENTDELFPKYFCPYLKNVTEFILREDFVFEKLILTDGCDSSKRIYECWKELGVSKDLYFLKIPFGREEEDIKFFADELEDIYVNFLGGKDKNKLIDAIEYYNENYLSSLKLPFEDILGNRKIENSKLKVYFVSTMFPPSFIDFLKELDIEIAYSEFCFSRRVSQKIDNYKDDPFYALSSYYLKDNLCLRSLDIDDYVSKILKVKDKIDGVIIYSLKYCDPILYQYGLLRKKLREYNIPILIIEDDYTLSGKEQMRTRLEAFIEMVYENR